jgi:YfiR/HmsC-like
VTYDPRFAGEWPDVCHQQVRRTVSRAFHPVPLQVCRAVSAICLLLCIALPLPAQQSTAAEYRSKANFLATFPSFVDWPESAFSSTQAPLLICVRGDFSFGTSLAELARGALSHGRRIEVRWVHKDQELRTCHIAFVSRSESKRYAKLLQALDGAGVLTVGETDDFLAAGGAITFSFERETLQFEVNLVAAENARLKISSRLLALARRVRNKSEAAKG